MTRTLVVVGHGMTGHRLVTELRSLDRSDIWRVVVLAEEPHPAYDRIALAARMTGPPGECGELPGSRFEDDPLVTVRRGTAVRRLDRRRRTVVCADDSEVRYDALVLATGSRPFVPPVPGHDLPGCFTFRTLDDVAAIRAAARPGRPGLVIGGGLLGLEAANALRLLGMRPFVVEAAPRPMPLQVDEGGGLLLTRLIEELGVRLLCGTVTTSVDAGPDGRVRGVSLADGTTLAADLVVFSAGIRPRDELAAPAGLPTGERGGFLVDHWLRTDDPRIRAVGECAAVNGRCHGLLAPGQRMADSVARQLLDLEAVPFTGDPAATSLKLLGVGVASFGDAHATAQGAVEFRHVDHGTGTYRKLVLATDDETLLGGILVGDTADYPLLRSAVGHRTP